MCGALSVEVALTPSNVVQKTRERNLFHVVRPVSRVLVLKPVFTCSPPPPPLPPTISAASASASASASAPKMNAEILARARIAGEFSSGPSFFVHGRPMRGTMPEDERMAIGNLSKLASVNVDVIKNSVLMNQSSCECTYCFGLRRPRPLWYRPVDDPTRSK